MPVSAERVRNVRPDEAAAAFALAFHDCDGETRRRRVHNCLMLLAAGDLTCDAIWVADDGDSLVGVQVCALLRGAGALFWPPQSQPRNGRLEDRLVQVALQGVRQQGAKLAQALLTPEETVYADALLRSGFQHITRLQYLRHDLSDFPHVPHDLRLETYGPDNQTVFHQTLERSYKGTLDCPELDGLRTIDEVIEGHVAQGKFRPERWWLAFAALDKKNYLIRHGHVPGGEPGSRPKSIVTKANPRLETVVGVVLATEAPDGGVWDLSYLGIVPEARGRGLGRALTAHVLHEARRAQMEAVILAVDARNAPALQLYKSLNFQTGEPREVYLHVLGTGLPKPNPESPT